MLENLGAALRQHHGGTPLELRQTVIARLQSLGADALIGHLQKRAIDLPRGLLEAVAQLESDAALAEVLSPEFIGLYAGVKRGEFETFMQVISPWEREFLLLNV